MSQLQPEDKPRELEYARAEAPRTGQLLMGVFGGVFGYLGLMVVMLFGMSMFNADVPGWVRVVTMLGVPVVVMLGAARLLKSKTMVVSTLITFGVVALSCGTCFALFAH